MKKLIFKIIFIIFFSTNLASEEVLKIGIDEYKPFVFSKAGLVDDYNLCAYAKDNNPGFEFCLKYLPYYGAEIDLIQYLCGGFSDRVKFDKIYQCAHIRFELAVHRLAVVT